MGERLKPDPSTLDAVENAAEVVGRVGLKTIEGAVNGAIQGRRSGHPAGVPSVPLRAPLLEPQKVPSRR